MSDSYKKLAISMLYVGLAALFAALATYLIGGFFSNITKILLIVGACLLIGYLAVSPEVIMGAFRSRSVRYGGNSLAMAALFIVIIGAGNWFTNSHSQSFDMTRDKLHTLTPQTLDILKNVHQDVKVTAFFQTGSEQDAKDLLAEYAAHSGSIQYRFVDPDKDPATARQFGIVSYGTTVFQSGSNRKDVPSVGEQEFTSAILTVTSTERRKIYFVTGNGQPDPTSSADQQGFHNALLALQNDNYVVATLDATAPNVPDDASAVILTAGTKPLLDSQKAALTTYLAKGGKLLITSAGFADTDSNELIKPYGLQFQQGATIEANSANVLQQLGPQAPAVSRYSAPGNDIVKNLTFSVYPLANGIDVSKPPPQGITTTVIAASSEQSWLQNHKDTIQFQQGDTRGPITLVASAEGTLATPPSPSASGAASAAPTPIGGLPSPSAIATPPPASSSAQASASGSAAAGAQPTQTPTPIPQVTGSSVNLKGGTRIVAVADTAWMSDQFLDQIPGNHDLFLNIINHLVGNTALVNIPARNAQDTQVNLLGSDANLIFFTTVVLVPLLVLGVGGAIWWSRR